MTTLWYLDLSVERERVSMYARSVSTGTAWSWREYEGYRTASHSVRMINMFDREHVAVVF